MPALFFKVFSHSMSIGISHSTHFSKVGYAALLFQLPSSKMHPLLSLISCTSTFPLISCAISFGYIFHGFLPPDNISRASSFTLLWHNKVFRYTKTIYSVARLFHKFGFKGQQMNLGVCFYSAAQSQTQNNALFWSVSGKIQSENTIQFVLSRILLVPLSPVPIQGTLLAGS